MLGGCRAVQQLADGSRELDVLLTGDQLGAFRIYYETLVAWNERMNLTRITDYEAVQVKHFLDSLSCLPVIKDSATVLNWSADAGLRAIDVGTGAGFPGIPLKIALPALSLTLLEATGKKAEFLRFLVERLRLSQVVVANSRAEEAGQDLTYREQYDLALARALARMATLSELTLPFVRVGGLVIAQKGEDPTAEVKAAQKAIVNLGGQVQNIVSVSVPGLAQERHLVVLEKVSSTPGRYPRRSGMPAKRPLG
jgi:16S rRNA (guanine527-N7)-methyltransferase